MAAHIGKRTWMEIEFNKAILSWTKEQLLADKRGYSFRRDLLTRALAHFGPGMNDAHISDFAGDYNKVKQIWAAKPENAEKAAVLGRDGEVQARANAARAANKAGTVDVDAKMAALQKQMEDLQALKAQQEAMEAAQAQAKSTSDNTDVIDVDAKEVQEPAQQLALNAPEVQEPAPVVQSKSKGKRKQAQEA